MVIQSEGADGEAARKGPYVVNGHCDGASLPTSIHIAEVGPRDGLQIEATLLTTPQKLELIDRLVRAGLREIEIGSFVNPRAVPQMADTPELFQALAKRPGVMYRAIWLNAQGLDRALQTETVDMDAKLAINASETFARRNTNRGIADGVADIPTWIARYLEARVRRPSLTVMAAFGCNYEGRIPMERVQALIGQAVDVARDAGLPLESLCLADTMGWANPLQVKRMVGGVRERWPEMEIKLHLHDTRGCAIANALAGMELGVRSFDAAVGGLGGCPFAGHKGAAGNICTEDLALACQEMGVETGIDVDALAATARWLEEVLGHPLPGKVMKGGSLPCLQPSPVTSGAR